MYKYFLLLYFPVFMWGQKQKIQGTVMFSDHTGLSGIPVEVYNADHQRIGTVQTGAGGIFILEGFPGPSVKLVITTGDYGRVEKVVDLEKPEPDLILTLKKNEQVIEAVTMSHKKPMVKRKVDRLEFNVENSNISSLNAWEILKKTPNVTANNDVLAVKGSTGILITINDKKIMMSGDELKAFLENTQGDDIRSVEVITNPPAKYEAQGSAVLNIIMKKNKVEGYKGVLSSKYVQTQYAKGNIGLSQYYRKNKLSLMAAYYYGSGTYYREGTDYVHYQEDQTRWVSTCLLYTSPSPRD